MTRSERAKANAQLKKQRARAILLGFIQNNLLVDEFKKSDGTWNITKLAKATKLSRPTIINHLKELKEEGLI
jgi:Fic family protein